MPDISVERIRAIFDITDEVLVERERIGGYIDSFIPLIVDSFYDDYLAGNKHLSSFSGSAGMVRFKRSLKDYLVTLFQSPFDADLIHHTSSLGVIYKSVHLEPIIMARGFDMLHQILCDLAEVNETVRQDLALILRILKIAEFLMIEAYHEESSHHHTGTDNATPLVAAFDRLFRIYTQHSNGLKKISELWSVQQRPAALDDISDCMRDRQCQCPATDVLREISNRNLDRGLQLDLAAANRHHRAFHETLADFIEKVEHGAPEDEVTTAHNLVQKHSEAFLATIGKPLQDITAISFLAVNSGFRFMQLVSQSLFDQDTLHLDHRELVELLQNEIPRILTTTMGWCIDDIVVSPAEMADGDHDIVSSIPLKSLRLYIGINLKNLPNRMYLEDLLQMMLELVRINLANKEREGALVEMAASAERASQAKNDFLANMSHELRTPLNAINGFAQVIENRSDLAESLRPYIGKIRLAGNNLLQQVDTILDFAKLEAGEIAYDPVHAAFQDIFQEAVLLTEPLANGKSLTFDHPGITSATVEMDPQLIKQVLLNLLSNAVKFTPEGGRIWFDLQYSPAETLFRISVGDSGVGIASENFKDLFSPFKQLAHPLRKTAGGTGLGLSIAKRIIEDYHGGTLSVESRIDHGSVFTFTLPVTQAPTFVTHHECPEPDAQRLLIAEDSPEYLNLLVISLRDQYHLTVTNSVVEAIQILNTEKYDQCLLDYFLVDGISPQIISHITEQSLQLPCLIISAEEDNRDILDLAQNETVSAVFDKDNLDRICAFLQREQVS